MAAAKREGVVSWYTSTPIVAAQKVANLFQAETGIKVELFRSGGSAVLRRFLQEIDAKRVLADVLTVSDPAEVNGLAKRDLLVPFRPRNFDKIPDAVKDPKGQHIAQRVNLAGIIMRTDKGLEAPKNWLDLTDPKYKGVLVMPDPSYTAIQLMVVGTLSRKYGWEFYQKLRANDIMIVQGHQQVSEVRRSSSACSRARIPTIRGRGSSRPSIRCRRSGAAWRACASASCPAPSAPGSTPRSSTPTIARSTRSRASTRASSRPGCRGRSRTTSREPAGSSRPRATTRSAALAEDSALPLDPTSEPASSRAAG